ncbi:MAG: hypothetical protein JST28_09095 [Acidobacteria bacterium]|nr:hypothetical protein [Acidobacteriota bacterium]
MRLKFPGVPVYLNGQNYFIPSISTRQYKENQAALEGSLDQKDGESVIAYAIRVQEAAVPIIGMALRRNYPHVTDDDLWDWLDAHTFNLAWKATQNASGMTPVTEGEAEPTASQPTGTGSTGA